MKQLSFILSLILIAQTLVAQKKTGNEYLATDKRVLELPDSLSKKTEDIASYISANFKDDNEKSRAIFIWVATNIQYDIENMFALNFYEKKEEKILKPLKTKKGICENYAALFTDICQKAGIRSFVVEGYTKQNGFADYIPHAWSAALIDSTWYLFDPTWGSGYVSGGKFFKKINNDHYKANPALFNKTHMPFDPLWQFLDYPISNQEFYEGKAQQNKAFFNFKDSIEAYEKQSHLEQLASSAYRIEKNGVKNSLIFDRLQHLKLEIENNRQTTIMNLYNSAVVDYNDGVNDFNTFINYRNKQFTPLKADSEIQNMVTIVDSKFKSAKSKLLQISNPDFNTTNLIQQLTKSIDDVTTHVTEQNEWLKVYFSKGKSGRKSMFYEQKFTWFGIPLN
jgi:hypothetical protein